MTRTHYHYPPMPLTRLTLERLGDITHVRFPAARTDGVAVRELYETAIELLEAPPAKMLVDLSEVPLVTSGAMGMFISIRRKFMGHGAQLHIAAPEPMVRESMRIASLHLILQIYDSVEAARAAFK